jgi:YidC/Oxa1 family membrane protein insertase
MNNTRLMFAIATAFLAFMLMQQWQMAQLPPAAPNTSPTSASGSASTPSPATTATAGELPTAPIANAQPDQSLASASSDSAQTPAQPTATLTRVETDVLSVKISSIGADIQEALLKTYTHSLKDKTPVALVEPTGGHWLKPQSGLMAVAGGVTLPNHTTVFSAPAGVQQLAEGAKTLEVPFTWTDASGVSVKKIYRFERGSFAVQVRFEIDNASATPLNVLAYRQLQQPEPPAPQSSFFGSPDSFAHNGFAIYSPADRFQKLKFGDLVETPLKRSHTGGWIASLRHNFFVSWIPAAAEMNEYSTAVLTPAGSTAYVARIATTPVQIAAGASGVQSAQLYIGPKDQKRIEKIAPGLSKVVDYGIFTIFSDVLFKVLAWLHTLTGNWGWAIILLVLILKTLFYKLSEIQFRSGAKMKAISPKIAELKKRYPDDAQKFGMAQMELLRKEKVNPLAGCFPVLLTIPVFLGLYWVLADSVEMRQAPFIGWIKDLTAADPYFVLPILNGIVMFLTSKMTPMTGMDPIQQKVFTYMPLLFAVMMAFFPAGLVLYWTVNGLLGLAQQYYITKKIEDEMALKRAS